MSRDDVNNTATFAVVAPCGLLSADIIGYYLYSSMPKLWLGYVCVCALCCGRLCCVYRFRRLIVTSMGEYIVFHIIIINAPGLCVDDVLICSEQKIASRENRVSILFGYE